MSNMPNRKIAITGTIGSGKSSVTTFISKKYPTISSDQIVSDLYESNDFIKYVNKEILNVDSDILNKKMISDAIFNNKELKAKLESIIHPQVEASILDFFNTHEGLVFTEVPLLFEADFKNLFDKIIVVVADESVILDRLQKYRGYSLDESMQRINNQFSIEYKINHADYVIYNNSTLEKLYNEVDKIIKEIECDKNANGETWI